MFINVLIFTCVALFENGKEFNPLSQSDQKGPELALFDVEITVFGGSLRIIVGKLEGFHNDWLEQSIILDEIAESFLNFSQ